MSKKFTTYLFTVSMLLSGLSLSAQNTALSFNGGTADYATTATNTYPLDGNAFTAELWVFIPAAEPGYHSFMSQGMSSLQFALGYNGDNNHIYMGDSWVESNTSIGIGRWNHIAISWDGGAQAYLYLDGKKVDSMLNGSYIFIPSGTQFQLGTDVDNSTTFTGSIDNVRIWNYVRSDDQIKQGMYGTVNPSDPVVNYLFDAGTGVTTNSGSLGNVDITLENSTTTAASPIAAGQNSLSFRNSVHTKAVAPGSPDLDLTYGTIEAWINPNTTNGVILSLGDTSASPASNRFAVVVDNTIPGANTVGIRNSAGSLLTLPYVAGFTPGSWYHLALVTGHDNGNGIDTTGIYVNAVRMGYVNRGYNTSAGSSLPLAIGANGFNNSENWDGDIDDVSIWNISLPQSTIANHVAASPTGNETGLVAYYNFDQGTADQDNSGLNVAIDYAPPTNNAVMSNFSLAQSSTTNFTVGHSFTPLPILLTQFTVTKQSNTALVQWQTGQEQNSRDFIIERSSNGSDFTDIGTVAAAGTSHTKRYYAFTDNTPLEGKNYYRLRETDLDGKSTYSAVKVLSFTMAGNLIWYSTGTNAAEVRLHNGSNEMYTIADMAGHTLRTGRLSSGVVGLSQLPSGIYFVKVVTNAGNELTAKVLLR